MSEDVKALTHVNLPFIEERYAPGETIPYERFVASAEQAQALITHPQGSESTTPSADEMIAEMEENGAVSSDHDAPVHPDHLPVDPNRVTLSSIVADAERLIAELEEVGAEVPAKLRALANISDRQVGAADAAAIAVDEVAE